MSADGQTATPGWTLLQLSDLPGGVPPVPVITPATSFFDDFSQTADGSLPDGTKWAIAENGNDPTGGSQIYTRDPAVAGVKAGAGVNGSNALVFQVQAYNGTPFQRAGAGAATISPAVGQYLSARITTFPEPAGNDTLWSWMRPGFQQFSATYGTFEAVAKFNPAPGYWPAIWCYGTDKRWPHGEIDLVENFGGSPRSGTDLNFAYFNVFGLQCAGDYNGAGYEGSQPKMNASPAPIGDGLFHTYRMTISPDYSQISFAMDGVSYQNSPVAKAGWLAAMKSKGWPNAIWPYGPDTPLGIVMNVCVGGPNTVGGGLVPFPSASQPLPVTIMTIDSVSWTIP